MKLKLLAVPLMLLVPALVFLARPRVPTSPSTLVWEHPAPSQADIDRYQWRYYLGDATSGGVPLTGVVCHETARGGTFTCATAVPKITGWIRLTGQASGHDESAPAPAVFVRGR